MADANFSSLANVKETTWGTTPGTPSLIAMRLTGESISHKKDTVTSDEVRSDRQTSDLVEVGAQAEGEVSMELSVDEYEKFFLGALMAAAWVTLNVTHTASLVSAAKTITGTAGDFTTIPVGGFVKVAGFTAPGNNGIKLVVAKNGDASVLTFATGSFVSDEATVAVTITGKDARNGSARHSWSMERNTPGVDGTAHYQQYVGMMVDECNVSAVSKQIVKGSFKFLGKEGNTSESSLDGDAYTAATTDPVLNGTSNVGVLSQAGAAMTEKLKELSFTIKNNLRGKDVLAQRGIFEVGVGSCLVTGKLSAYFQTNALYSALINHSSSSLGIVLTDSGGKSIAFVFPKVKFGAGDPNIKGKDTDIMIDVDFTAILDPVSGSTVIINRFP